MHNYEKTIILEDNNLKNILIGLNKRIELTFMSFFYYCMLFLTYSAIHYAIAFVEYILTIESIPKLKKTLL